jgi:hypothetical protein
MYQRDNCADGEERDMIDTLIVARPEENGQTIAEFILALILVIAGGTIRLIMHAITGQ